MKDPIVGLARMVQNSIAAARAAIASRAGQMYDGLRKVWSILGYKTELRYEDYLAMYLRQDVAGRIVDMPAQETWRNPPKLVPNDKNLSTENDKFFAPWEELVERLHIWSEFEKIDRLSGIGKFGVMIIGVKDGATKLEEPVTREDLKPEDILYINSYPEGRCEILEIDENEFSPRFGLPIRYRIDIAEFTDPKGERRRPRGSTKSPGKLERVVHWTRVIHVADGPMSDKIYGRPRLERVFNNMWDILKIAGGSAEMFWQNVAQIFHVNLDPELEYDDDDLEELDDKFKEMLQGIRRIIQTEGIDKIEALQGGTPDPRGIFSVLKTLSAAAAEIPQRILYGSEQGEMASTQDKSEWYGRITSRIERHAEPNILKALINRFASWGILVLPQGGYSSEWPSMFEQTPGEKAIVGRNLAMAASKMDAKRPDRVIGIAEIREASGLPRAIPEDVQKDITEMDQKKKDEAAALPDPTAIPSGTPNLQVASSR